MCGRQLVLWVKINIIVYILFCTTTNTVTVSPCPLHCCSQLDTCSVAGNWPWWGQRGARGRAWERARRRTSRRSPSSSSTASPCSRCEMQGVTMMLLSLPVPRAQSLGGRSRGCSPTTPCGSPAPPSSSWSGSPSTSPWSQSPQLCSCPCSSSTRYHSIYINTLISSISNWCSRSDLQSSGGELYHILTVKRRTWPMSLHTIVTMIEKSWWWLWQVVWSVFYCYDENLTSFVCRDGGWCGVSQGDRVSGGQEDLPSVQDICPPWLQEDGCGLKTVSGSENRGSQTRLQNIECGDIWD